jgi:Holliday junction resolvasome RuvABC endonuclease subunit
MKTIKAIAIDMAFANMGLARVDITMQGKVLRVHGKGLLLVSTEREGHKQVRKSSDDLRRALILVKELNGFAGDAQIAFAEVPSGSQSASAARALGIAVGALASCPIPIIEVSPMEVKKLFSPDGKRKVPKTEIIAWAMKEWPDLPWLRHGGKATLANEHLADAMAVAMAGIATTEFKQLIAIHHEVPSTTLQRPAPNRRSLY